MTRALVAKSKPYRGATGYSVQAHLYSNDIVEVSVKLSRSLLYRVSFCASRYTAYGVNPYMQHKFVHYPIEACFVDDDPDLDRIVDGAVSAINEVIAP